MEDELTTRRPPSDRPPPRWSVLELVDGESHVPELSLGVAEDPSTGEPLGLLASSSAEAVDRAIGVAYAAWRNAARSSNGVPLGNRLAALERLAGAVEQRADAIAYWHAREIGIPIRTARLFAAGLADAVRGIAAIAPAVLANRPLPAGDRRVEIQRLPWGPAALFTAWNAPAFLAVTKLAHAIAAGCPAILKPSEYTPATTGVVVDALRAADLPPGAAQVVCGGAEVGLRLAADRRVRMINYTGGTAGGRAVAAEAIGRMAAMQLELSASNPAIVAPRANIDRAAAELARAMLVLNGQWCEAPRRAFVHVDDHDALVARLIGELEGHVMGPALAPTTGLGPLAHRAHLRTVEEAVGRLDAVGEIVRSPAQLPDAGFYMAPTVAGGLALDAVDREIFGPVLAVCPYRDIEDALHAANALGDGLAGYVFAGDRDEAFAIGCRLHAGEVRLGGARLLDLAEGSAQSFWGTSGLGGHGHASVLAAHVGTRVIGEEDEALAL